MVMGGDSYSEGRGFDSLHCILDEHFSQIFVVVIVMLFEKTKINEKDAGDGPFIKKLTAGKNKTCPRQFPLSRSSSTGTRTPPS